MPERGVSHGTEDTYNPSNSSTHVFDMQFLKIDSDKAFTEAQKHGGEALLEEGSEAARLLSAGVERERIGWCGT